MSTLWYFNNLTNQQYQFLSKITHFLHIIAHLFSFMEKLISNSLHFFSFLLQFIFKLLYFLFILLLKTCWWLCKKCRTVMYFSYTSQMVVFFFPHHALENILLFFFCSFKQFSRKMTYTYIVINIDKFLPLYNKLCKKKLEIHNETML